MMRASSQAAVSCANRWLDNIEALRSWCKRKFEGREAEVEAFFKENGCSDGALEYIDG